MTWQPNGEKSLPPASPARAPLAADPAPPGGCWRAVRVVAETGSTNADLVALAAAGEPEGVVLAAESQTAGRGRLDRHWLSAPGAGLTFSALLRPAPAPPVMWGWIPLLTGVAVAAAVRATTGIPAVLKWPNDVMVGDRKLAGILVEGTGEAVVAGCGINVSQREAELPVATATSVWRETGHTLDRNVLLRAVLAELARWYLAWRDQPAPGDAGACGLRQEYLRRCATTGRNVVIGQPGGDELTGVAAGVDLTGRLEIRGGDQVKAVSAGDVIHLR